MTSQAPKIDSKDKRLAVLSAEDRAWLDRRVAEILTRVGDGSEATVVTLPDADRERAWLVALVERRVAFRLGIRCGRRAHVAIAYRFGGSQLRVGPAGAPAPRPC